MSPHDTLHSVVWDAATSVRYPKEKKRHLLLKLHKLHLMHLFDKNALMLHSLTRNLIFLRISLLNMALLFLRILAAFFHTNFGAIFSPEFGGNFHTDFGAFLHWIGRHFSMNLAPFFPTEFGAKIDIEIWRYNNAYLMMKSLLLLANTTWMGGRFFPCSRGWVSANK